MSFCMVLCNIYIFHIYEKITCQYFLMRYDYIKINALFSILQDLQVKSSQPVQPTQPINNDPAIIQVVTNS